VYNIIACPLAPAVRGRKGQFKEGDCVKDRLGVVKKIIEVSKYVYKYYYLGRCSRYMRINSFDRNHKKMGCK